MSSYIITVKILKLRFGQFSVHKSIINNGKYVQNICLLKTIMTVLYQNHYTEQSITQHVCMCALHNTCVQKHLFINCTIVWQPPDCWSKRSAADSGLSKRSNLINYFIACNALIKVKAVNGACHQYIATAKLSNHKYAW